MSKLLAEWFKRFAYATLLMGGVGVAYILLRVILITFGFALAVGLPLGLVQGLGERSLGRWFTLFIFVHFVFDSLSTATLAANHPLIWLYRRSWGLEVALAGAVWEFSKSVVQFVWSHIGKLVLLWLLGVILYNFDSSPEVSWYFLYRNFLWWVFLIIWIGVDEVVRNAMEAEPQIFVSKPHQPGPKALPRY